jgi:pyruvate-formate lyase-activating enzyme
VNTHPARGLVTLTHACTHACVFCDQQGLAPRPALGAEGVRAALATLRETHDEVSFVGGEPGLDDALEAHVAAARALGFTRIGVQSNASNLVDASLCRRLAQQGLTDLHLTLLGAEAAVHDHHTGRAGSFEEVLRALAAARGAGLDVLVTTVLTRSNYRVLDALAALVVARGVTAWCVAVPVVAGRAEERFDRVYPRLGLALPFAVRALSSVRARGMTAFVAGAPLCLLGPFGAYAIAGDALTGGTRAHAPACDACPLRAACPGVDAAYLARFDGDELAPRDTAVAPDLATLAHPLARTFVGPGERAPRRAERAEPSPAKARRALPMLGRGAPAVAEVGRGERRSGEALRALFPALFEGDAPARNDDVRGDDDERG